MGPKTDRQPISVDTKYSNRPSGRAPTNIATLISNLLEPVLTGDYGANRIRVGARPDGRCLQRYPSVGQQCCQPTRIRSR
jgi:hypothetical protein